MILEPPQIKSDTVYTVSPYICHEVMGPDALVMCKNLLGKEAYSMIHPAYPCPNLISDQSEI